VAGTKGGVKVNMTIAYRATDTKTAFSRDYLTTVTKVNAITFDSDILPDVTNLRSVGLESLRWKNGYFSGDVKVSGNVTASGYITGTTGLCMNTDCRTSWGQITGLTGSGTLNYISKWTSSDAIGNSQIFDNGTNVGIGTTSPGAKLSVYPTSGQTTPVIEIPYNNSLIAQTFNFFSYPGGKQYSGFGIQNGETRYYYTNASSLTIGTLSTADGSTFSEKMRITSTGNVGIGTTAPKNKLDIEGGLAVGATYSGTNTAPTNGMIIEGNVGIGTTAPGGKLTVLGGEGTYAAPNFGSTNRGAINIRAVTSDTRNAITFSSAGSDNAQAGIYVHQDNSAGTHMYLATTNSYATGPQARMTILNNGNIGIGTTSPGAKLDVAGIIRTNSQLISTVANGTAPLAVNSKTLVTNLNADLLDGYDSSYFQTALTNPITGTGTTGYLPKFTEASTIDNSPVYTDGTNIGIGTTEPTGKLHIQGGRVYVDSDNFGRIPTIDLAVGDTDTGLDSAGDGQLDLYSDNVNTMSIRTGNVGIGTTSPRQELDLIGDLELENTTSNDTGVIYKGVNRFIHNFQHSTGDTAKPAGYNTFVGVNAGNFVMGLTATKTYHGSYNSAMGSYALYSNAIGFHNSAMGSYALHYNTIGYYNSAMGSSALFSNTTGYYNSAMGYSALYSNTTGFDNSAIGSSALYSNTTGYHNSAIGYSALYSNTEGSNNSAMGSFALYSNTAGYRNSAMGYYVLSSNTTGSNNSAMGYYALSSNTEGFNNSAMGHNALYYNTTGSSNSAMGSFALFSNTIGYYNIGIGYNAGKNITTGSNNIIIGSNINAPSATGNYQLNIGNTIYGDLGNDKIAIGTETLNRKFYVNGDAGGTTPWYNDSDTRLKTNVQTISNALEKVEKMRGVSFTWIDTENHPKGQHIGFIAQELKEVLPEVVDKKGEYYSVQESSITAVLVEAIKEQQKQIEDLKAQIKTLKHQ